MMVHCRLAAQNEIHKDHNSSKQCEMPEALTEMA